MHITITGNLGSGKSTICKLLNETYQFEVYSTGKVQREIASKMNMTTLELNQLMCSDHKYDTMIDDETTRISRDNKDKNIIFDSRLAWHFVESSFKVFVSVSLDVAASRVMQDKRGDVENYSSHEEAKKLLAERAATEKRRYKDIYNLDYLNFSNYDLIIDSTYCAPDIIVSIIMEEAKAYEEKKLTTETTKYLLSPSRLINIESITEIDQANLNQLLEEYKKFKYYSDKVVKVKKQEENYIVIEGMDEVKTTLLAQLPFVSVEVLN